MESRHFVLRYVPWQILMLVVGVDSARRQFVGFWVVHLKREQNQKISKKAPNFYFPFLKMKISKKTFFLSLNQKRSMKRPRITVFYLSKDKNIFSRSLFYRSTHLMTKNLMSKFKKPFHQSSKVVYDSRISQDGQEYPHFLTSSESRRDSVDRTELYRTVAANHENNKLIMRIPSLIRENQELRDKVELLEEEIKAIRVGERNRREISKSQERFSERERELHRSIRKILKECRPMEKKQKISHNSSRDRFKTEQVDTRSQLLKSYALNENIYIQEEGKESHTIRDYEAKLKRVENERDRLQKQKQELQTKYNKILMEGKGHSEDIDLILKKFHVTIDEKQELMNKKSVIYQQKIQSLESKVLQLQGQTDIIKLQNQSLLEKIAKYEILLNKKANNELQPHPPYQIWTQGFSGQNFPLFSYPQQQNLVDKSIRFSCENVRPSFY